MALRLRRRLADVALALTLGAAAAQAAFVLAQADETVVTVETEDDRFVPPALHFRQNVLYRLHLKNVGKELHEFTAPDFFRAVDVKTPDVLVAAGNDIVLQPGDEKDLVFIPRVPGRYGLTCADHDWAGMVGSITIDGSG
jgi:uncharacterized cupredoxin-like copper-binding protein